MDRIHPWVGLDWHALGWIGSGVLYCIGLDLFGLGRTTDKQYSDVIG